MLRRISITASVAILALVFSQLKADEPAPQKSGGDSGDPSDHWIPSARKRIDEISRDLQKNPADPTKLAYRAIAWMVVGDYGKAIADANEAIRLRPDAAYLFYYRGMIWSRKGESERAVADYTEAIRLDPSDTVAYKSRANEREHEGNFEKAIPDLDKAIQISPREESGYLVRGRAWQRNGKFDKALADYNKALHIRPTDVQVLLRRGFVLAKLKEFDRAIRACDESLRLTPKYADAYATRGDIWRMRGEYAKAMADYGEAIRVDPNSAAGFVGQAWVMAAAPSETVRNGRKAIEAATTACKLSEWKDAACLQALAAAYAESGDFDAAVQWQTRVIDDQKSSFLVDIDSKQRVLEQLESYRAKKPYREAMPGP